MVRKKVLAPDRVRSTGKSFCFISHRFLTDGFLQSLTRHELALYVFLILASDRNELFFYGDKTIQAILGLKDGDYIFARMPQLFMCSPTVLSTGVIILN